MNYVATTLPRTNGVAYQIYVGKETYYFSANWAADGYNFYSDPLSYSTVKFPLYSKDIRTSTVIYKSKYDLITKAVYIMSETFPENKTYLLSIFVEVFDEDMAFLRGETEKSIYPDTHPSETFIKDFLVHSEEPVNCYLCDIEGTRPLEEIIIHLNDEHNVSREDIADWIDTLPFVPTFCYTKKEHPTLQGETT